MHQFVLSPKYFIVFYNVEFNLLCANRRYSVWWQVMYYNSYWDRVTFLLKFKIGGHAPWLFTVWYIYITVYSVYVYLQVITQFIIWFFFPESKQNTNNVSFMTNKIELLTNSLSDPDFIGTPVDGMNWFLFFNILVIYFICYNFLEKPPAQQENLSKDDKHFNSPINSISNIENGTAHRWLFFTSHMIVFLTCKSSYSISQESIPWDTKNWLVMCFSYRFTLCLNATIKFPIDDGDSISIVVVCF